MSDSRLMFQADADVNDKVLAALETITEHIAWGKAAQFDFRSDVTTTPTIGMLAAIVQTTLGDDVYQEDNTTSAFERDVAALTGSEAGCFTVTGSMANQLALRSLLSHPPYGIICDKRAHILNWEAGGVAMLNGAIVQPVQPRNGRFLTVEDIATAAVVTDDVHKCPTRVIVLENTVAGAVVPIPEVAKIAVWAKEHGILIHMDGARLWEAAASLPMDASQALRQYCLLVDSIAVDFSKGLGAPMGAMVLGKADFIHRVRRIRKAIGGGMRQAGVISSAASNALAENLYTNFDRLLESHDLALQVGRMWTERGGCLKANVETNHVWIDLLEASLTGEMFNRLGAQNGVKLMGERIVLHQQHNKVSLLRLGNVFDIALAKRK